MNCFVNQNVILRRKVLIIRRPHIALDCRALHHILLFSDKSGSPHQILRLRVETIKMYIRTQAYAFKLQPPASTGYSLWKTTKHLKRITRSSPPLRTPHGTWANSNIDKAQTFANHLATIFQPHLSINHPNGEDAIAQLHETPYQLEPLATRITRAEVQAIISNLHPKKSSGYDLINGHILKALPPIGVQFLTQLFNAALLQGYFLAQWKVAQIILLLKPGKPPHELTSYRPISLLPPTIQSLRKDPLKPYPPSCGLQHPTPCSSVWLP
jgi:hypothetical protein